MERAVSNRLLTLRLVGAGLSHRPPPRFPIFVSQCEPALLNAAEVCSATLTGFGYSRGSTRRRRRGSRWLARFPGR